MFVREAGTGDPLVLLHGFPQTGRCWNAVAADLSDRFHILAPDLPGFGRSARPAGFDMRTLGRTMAAFLEAAGVAGAPVVGHDWGGALTYSLALSKAIPRFVIVNSPYRKIDYRRAWHMPLLATPVLPEVAFLLAGPRIVEWSLHAASTVPDAFDPDSMAEYKGAFASLERQQAAFAYYRGVTRSRLRSMLPIPGTSRSAPGQIEQPALIVWGTEDPVLPPSTIEGITDHIPNARVELLDGIGHFVPEEAPARLAGLVREFLS